MANQSISPKKNFIYTRHFWRCLSVNKTECVFEFIPMEQDNPNSRYNGRLAGKWTIPLSAIPDDYHDVYHRRHDAPGVICFLSACFCVALDKRFIKLNHEQIVEKINKLYEKREKTK